MKLCEKFSYFIILDRSFDSDLDASRLTDNSGNPASAWGIDQEFVNDLNASLSVPPPTGQWDLVDDDPDDYYWDELGLDQHRTYETKTHLSWEEFKKFMDEEWLGFSGEGGFIGFPGTPEASAGACIHFDNKEVYDRMILHITNASVIPVPPVEMQPANEEVWDQIVEELKKEFPYR